MWWSPIDNNAFPFAHTVQHICVLVKYVNDVCVIDAPGNDIFGLAKVGAIRISAGA